MEAMLAMEQYVLNGGSLIIFGEPKQISAQKGEPLINFLQNFGLSIVPSEIITDKNNPDNPAIFPSSVTEPSLQKDIRSVIVNEAGRLNLKKGKTYQTAPILKTAEQISGAISQGEYTSNYLNLAISGQHIEPASLKEGKVFFFYDTDLLKDYLFVSDESKGMDFYQIVPTSDNMLFLLRLLDFAAGANIESSLTYNHYALNTSSIGNAILDYINQYYAAQIKQLEENIQLYTSRKEAFYNSLKKRGFASIQNIGDISSIEQKIDENQNQLYRLKAEIVQYYQSAVMIFTVMMTFGVSLLLLCLFILLNVVLKRIRLKNIRRIVDAA